MVKTFGWVTSVLGIYPKENIRRTRIYVQRYLSQYYLWSPNIGNSPDAEQERMNKL